MSYQLAVGPAVTQDEKEIGSRRQREITMSRQQLLFGSYNVKGGPGASMDGGRLILLHWSGRPYTTGDITVSTK